MKDLFYFQTNKVQEMSTVLSLNPSNTSKQVITDFRFWTTFIYNLDEWFCLAMGNENLILRLCEAGGPYV